MWERLSRYEPSSFLGRAIRLPLRVIPKDAALPVVTGPARGLKWRVGSGQYGYWLGTAERDKRITFANSVAKGMVIYDIGANVGYYTTLAAKYAGSNGRVLAFEPVPQNVRMLLDNVSLNGFDNVEVLECALAAHSGVEFFALTGHPNTGHLDEDGDFEVPVFALDELIQDKALPFPDLIKIDVEGAEEAVLRGASQTISHQHPITFVAVHSDRLKAQCTAFMVRFGYKASELTNQPDELVFEHPDRTH